MKIKLDENLPARLRPLLVKLGHQVDTVFANPVRMRYWNRLVESSKRIHWKTGLAVLSY